MRFSERWLREWIDPPIDTAALCEQLTSLGLEVDGVEAARPAFERVVVGRIVAVRQHPDADRLRVCEVEAGEAAPLQVVCGAPNARPGLVTAFARVGGALPDGTRLERVTLRGVESFGMLCSGAELGLSADHGGIMELDDDAPPGAELGDWLGLDDTVIDVDLTPDRGDCLSIRGLARELSAKNALPIRAPATTPFEPVIDDTLPVRVEPASACARFTGRVVRDVDIGAVVPRAIVERLRRGGVRSINPAVDVTNHVMLELGQPMHAFDLDKLSGGLEVRLAEAGERLRLLDGREVALDVETTVIADDSGAIAIAGVMGGLATAVDATTRHVFLESALFLPADITGKPRRYACHTESSHRFERGVDPAAQREALEAATRLLVSMAGGRAGPVGEEIVASRLPIRAPAGLRASRLARVLGVAVPVEETVRILERLGVDCVPLDDADTTTGGTVDATRWRVTAPSHRWDLAIEEDFIEEVGRVRGYDALPRTLPAQRPSFRPVPETRLSEIAVKRLLASRGYQEIVTYAFVDDARQRLLRPDLPSLALSNPISSELGVMRTTLVGGLLDTYRRNASRQSDSMRLFESGLRFLADGDDAHLAAGHGEDVQIDATVRQQSVLAGLVAGRRDGEAWNTSDAPADFYSVKADVEALLHQASGGGMRFGPCTLGTLHPGQRATILAGEVPVGHVGALNPALQQPLDLPALPIVFELSLAALRAARLPTAAALSRFPHVRRDLAVVVDDALAHDALLATVRAAAPETLREVRVFDVYRGEGMGKGKKSMALSLILQDSSRTLDERDVERVVTRVVRTLERVHDARLRD